VSAWRRGFVRYNWSFISLYMTEKGEFLTH
jgi:hypothetical protein